MFNRLERKSEKPQKGWHSPPPLYVPPPQICVHVREDVVWFLLTTFVSIQTMNLDHVLSKDFFDHHLNIDTRISCRSF